MKRLLTPTETCDILGIKYGTLYQWVHHKKISYVKIGGKLAFKEDEIEKFVDTNSHTNI